jgi:hypothetical protein
MGYLSGTCVTWQEGSRLPRLPERETGRRTGDRIAIIRGEAIPSPGGEFREEREPVAADKGPAPFHRTAGGEAEPADQQRPGGRRSPEYALLRRGRHDPRICSRPPSTRTPVRAASSSYSAAWVKSASRSLTETLGENGVLSNYRFELTPRTWEFIRDLRGGTAIFTMPAGPIKCAGAPQKIAYLAADWWRSQGVLDKTRIILVLPTAAMFSQPDWAKVLAGVAAGYGIEVRRESQVTEVDATPGRR